MAEQQSVSRRQFLLGAASGGALVVSELTRARTMSSGVGRSMDEDNSHQGKPALTVRSINNYIATAEREDESTRLLLAAEVKRNVLAFLDQRFALSPAQRHALVSLTEEDRRRINIAVETSLRPGRRLVFRSATGSGAADHGSVDAPRAAASMTLTISDDTTAGRGAGPTGDVVLSWPCPPSRGKA